MLRIANLNLLIAAGGIFRNSWGFILASHTKLLLTINCVYTGTAVTEDIARIKQSTNSSSLQQKTLKLRVQSQHILRI